MQTIFTAAGYDKVNQIISEGGGSLMVNSKEGNPPNETVGGFDSTKIWAVSLEAIENDLKESFNEDENVSIGSAYEYENGYIIEISVD